MKKLIICTFFRAAAAHNLPVMCQAVALGADLEWRFVCLYNYNWIGALSVEIAHFVRMVSLDMYFCSRYANEEGRAAIHQSILSGSVMACEFLILNSVRIDAVDAQGNSALHMAAKQGNTGQVYARKGLLFQHSLAGLSSAQAPRRSSPQEPRGPRASRYCRCQL